MGENILQLLLFYYNSILMLIQAGDKTRDNFGARCFWWCECEILSSSLQSTEEQNIWGGKKPNKKKKRGRGKTSGPCAKVKGDMLLDYYCGRN